DLRDELRRQSVRRSREGVTLEARVDLARHRSVLALCSAVDVCRDDLADPGGLNAESDRRRVGELENGAPSGVRIEGVRLRSRAPERGAVGRRHRRARRTARQREARGQRQSSHEEGEYSTSLVTDGGIGFARFHATERKRVCPTDRTTIEAAAATSTFPDAL